ncbi:hypothetical protein CMI37_07560 [Candidatus Pacearchaeota archaeon]|jgi:hypothetical protein|nr:hypothetical protein [Candidatus Pacearchaeota archaeon]
MGIQRSATQYECDISGVAAEGIEEVDSLDEHDPLDDCPVGWSQVLIRTRMANPEFQQAQWVFQSTAKALMEELKDEKDKGKRTAAMFALRQQMIPMLSVAPFLANEVEMWVHPDYLAELMRRLDPELAQEHAAQANEIRSEFEDDDEEFEDEVEDGAEPAEMPPVVPPQAKTEKTKKAATG